MSSFKYKLIEYSVICAVISSFIYMMTGMALIPFVGVLYLASILILTVWKYTIVRTSWADFFLLLLFLSFLLPLISGRGSLFELMTPLAGVVVWFVLRNVVRDEKSILAVLSALQKSGIIVSLVMSVRLVVGTDIRNAGMFGGSANQTAILLFIGSFISLVSLLRENNLKSGLLLAYLFVCLLITTGRASWLALFISSSVFILISKIEINLKPYKIIFLATSLLAIVILATTLSSSQTGVFNSAYERVSSYALKGISGDRDVLSGRGAIWIAAIEMGKQSPYIGHGWNAPKNITTAHINKDVDSPHNTWLNTFIRSGLIGLFILSTFIFYFLYSLYYSHPSHVRNIIFSILCGLVALTFFESFTVGGLIIRNLMFTVVLLTCLPIINK